ncbi:MAG: cation diffusion facilitator family transporter [Pseudomonadota bacterium]
MSHDHSHKPSGYGRAFALGLALNGGFVIIEAFYGWQTQSLALLADAGHNLSDVAGLVLAWAALAASQLQADDRHTYGWQRSSILAGFANAIILLVAMGSLGWEAIERLRTPTPISAGTVMIVASIGAVINSLTAVLFLSGSKHDLNMRGAFLHMAADAMVSVGVVLAGAIYVWQGWSWIDPAVSLAITVLIIFGTWSLLRETLHLLFDGVPTAIKLTEVREALRNLPGVLDLHDLHVWALGTAENALTAHLVVSEQLTDHSTLLVAAEKMLHDRFEITHVTLQIESTEHARMCAPDVCSA